MPEHLAFRAFRFWVESQLRPVPDQAGTTTAISGMYDTLQTSQARVTFTIFRFAGRSAESETLRFRSCVEAWARTCRGVLEDTDSEGDATMGAVCGPGDDALRDAPPPAAAAAAGSPPSWLLRRCTPNIFGREDATSGGQAGYPRQPWSGRSRPVPKAHRGDCGIAPRRSSRELGTERRACESKSFSDDERISSRVVFDALRWVLLVSSVHAILASSLWGEGQSNPFWYWVVS